MVEMKYTLCIACSSDTIIVLDISSFTEWGIYTVLEQFRDHRLVVASLEIKTKGTSSSKPRTSPKVSWFGTVIDG